MRQNSGTRNHGLTDRPLQERTVADLVGRLVAHHRGAGLLHHRDPQIGQRAISVSLTELVGLQDDQTIDWLACMVQAAVLTPATAVHLAIRHAREIENVRPA